MNKLKTARNDESKQNIVKAAMYSFVGVMIYRKWVPSSKKYVRKRYKIIPIDCGFTSKHNAVLFAQDYEDNKQIKQFIINQIQKFQSLKQKIHPLFPIQVENIKRMLSVNDIKQEGTDENI